MSVDSGGHWRRWKTFKRQWKERKKKGKKEKVDSSKEEIDVISLDSDDD